MVNSLKHLMDMLDPRRSDKRFSSRATPRGLVCSAGRVLDCSPTGMKVQSSRPWPEGESRTVVLEAPPHRLEVPATAVWGRKEGWRRHVIGVRFDFADEKQRATVAALGQRNAAPAKAKAAA